MVSESGISIGSRRIGPGAPPLLIAEIGQAHDGSVGMAHSFIDIAAECGVDAVKFQLHIADEESTSDDKFRTNFSYSDSTRLGYWRRIEFDFETWKSLATHAAESGLIFLSSAFSELAVDWLADLNVPAWKLSSGELSNSRLITKMARHEKPFIISTGMSSWAEIKSAASTIEGFGRQFAMLQCTSQYPTPLDRVGLNVLQEFRSRFPNIPNGLSDHSGSLWPSVFAMANGANMIEVHLALHRLSFGPDTSSALSPGELGQLVEARDALHTILKHPVDKDSLATELAATKALFSRSVAPTGALPKGHSLRHEDLTLKKPGGGIPPQALDSLVGRRLARPVHPTKMLQAQDLEPSPE